ncbi:MAG: hypothetical protein PHV18_08185 [Lachnospiraceae bacterium]|nr:hypothetical protein [Lachnospiraceae bacterium]
MKHKRPLLAALLLLFILILLFCKQITTLAATPSNATHASDREIRRTNEPNLLIKNVSNVTLAAGQEAVIEFTISNLSRDYDIRDLFLTYEASDQIELSGSASTQLIKRLSDGGTRRESIKVRAAQEITSANQSITVSMKYDYFDDDDELQSGSATGKILVKTQISTNKTADPILLVERGSIGTVSPSQQFSVDVGIKNLSPDTVMETVIASFETGEALTLLDATSSRVLTDLAPGQTQVLTLRLAAGKEQAHPAQSISVSLKYDYRKGGSRAQGTSSEKINIPVVQNGGKTIARAVPNLIISNYQYGDQISIGDQFDLDLKFKNTSTNLKTENIVMTVEPEDGLNMTSASNTLYIPLLEAGAEYGLKIPLEAVNTISQNGVKQSSAKLTISFKYEYVDNDQRSQTTTSEKISIPIYQADRFTITPPESIDALYVGQEFTLSLPYVNKGRLEISNVEADIETQDTVLQKHQNLGNFEAGKSGTVDFILTPQTAGKRTVNVSIKYEDSALNQKSVIIPVELDVQEAAPEDTSDMENMDADAGGKRINPFFIAIPLLFLGAGVAMKLRSLRKKKAAANQGQSSGQEELDEIAEHWEDDDET